jgi:hypothetical protein
MKAFIARLHQMTLQQIVKKALKLAPRGGVRNDVLELNKLSKVLDQELQLEWRARDVHPWDCELSPPRQAELFCQQALHDTESALLRLFQRLPDIDQIDFRVLEPHTHDTIILAGSVEREEMLPACRSESIKWRLMMIGVRFILAGDHLEPLAA